MIVCTPVTLKSLTAMESSSYSIWLKFLDAITDTVVHKLISDFVHNNESFLIKPSYNLLVIVNCSLFCTVILQCQLRKELVLSW